MKNTGYEKEEDTALTHESGTLISHNFNIKRGTFQGNALSPLIFCISPILLSEELNFSGYGYKIGTEQIAHLFYMDNLKLYAKSDVKSKGFSE